MKLIDVKSVALLALLAAGCGVQKSTSSAFRATATSYGALPDTTIVASGDQLAFLADEASTGTPASGGTILNADGDKLDQVVVVVDTQHRTETTLGIAALDLSWIGGDLYLVVSEALDGRSWSTDGDMDDLVLVHWSRVDPVARFVDTLDPASRPRFVAVGSRLFFVAATTPTLPTQSSLCYVSTSAPIVPAPVATTDSVGPLRPVILGMDEGLVFLGLRESVEGRDLNGDLLADGDLVLALLDGLASTSVLRSTRLALPNASTTPPLRAKRVNSNDWQVAFLVNEEAQGDTNLNAPAAFASAWFPTQCAGHADVDTSDDVLHYLRFAAWVQDPAQNPPRNTGLVGARRIAIANGFVATITPEGDADGALGEGTCDLNGDGDTLDEIARWTQIVSGTNDVLPLNASLNLHALADVPGGTHGLAELSNRFVIVVDEDADELDIDGDGRLDFDLVGWLLPSTTPAAWRFDHGGNGAPVGASWVGEQRDRARLGVALQEVVGGASLNAGSASNPGDQDLSDSVPTFAAFSSSGVLVFPGVAIACDPANAGIVVARETAFYRVKEADDSRDGNGDGDEDDRILWRTSLEQATSNATGTSSTAARLAVDLSASDAAPRCGAFLTDESKVGAAGTDLDGDGDRVDLVLQFFRFDG